MHGPKKTTFVALNNNNRLGMVMRVQSFLWGMKWS